MISLKVVAIFCNRKFWISMRDGKTHKINGGKAIRKYKNRKHLSLWSNYGE